MAEERTLMPGVNPAVVIEGLCNARLLRQVLDALVKFSGKKVNVYIEEVDDDGKHQG